MPILQHGPETTFNDIYDKYDNWRPAYVDDLYKDIFAYKEINQTSNVLEIGIGTGQATIPVLNTGCFLTAVELGDKLSEFTRQKFIGYKNLEIKNMAFQDFECPDKSLDMVFSASAFHWIPEETGYPKVYRMLKPGGIFARFANHPYKDKDKEDLHIEMQKIYAEYMPGNTFKPEYNEADAQKRAVISEKYGFVDVKYKIYHRTRTFDSQEYIALLDTYSDHRALDESTRIKFFNKIKNAIDAFGGQITIFDTIDLQLARKSPS